MRSMIGVINNPDVESRLLKNLFHVAASSALGSYHSPGLLFGRGERTGGLIPIGIEMKRIALLPSPRASALI